MKWNRLLQGLATVGLGGLLGWMGLSMGCNKEFISSLGGDQNLPTTPGVVNYIQLRYYNAATMLPGTGMGFNPMWRFAGGPSMGFGGVGDPGLAQGEDIGDLLPCNLTNITLGDLTDPTVPGAWVSYHPPLDPVHRPLKPFGKVLQNGVDFFCGDTITFITIQDLSAKEGYSITYNVQSGQDQPTTFSGPDAFALYQKEVNDFNTLIGQGGYPIF
jgi:hypothetical protein